MERKYKRLQIKKQVKAYKKHLNDNNLMAVKTKKGIEEVPKRKPYVKEA